MEVLMFLFPWVLCVVVSLLLRKQKKLRAIEQENARNEIAAIRAAATAETKKAEARVSSAEKEAELKIAQEKENTQLELHKLHQQAEQRIREDREAIQLKKETLLSLSEKELLVECLSAVGTYAHRLDRLENMVSNIAIALNSSAKSFSQKSKPYVDSGRITDDDLIAIVREEAKHIDRISELTVNNAVVRGLVLSLQKSSTWSFRIDFNDNGRLTGHYSLYSENADSSIPQKLAKEVSKEIVYRLNMTSER